MKYMLMMNTPGSGDYGIATWAPKDIQAHIGFMIAFAKKLGEAGELVAAEGLAAPNQAKLVRAGKEGARSPMASSRNRKSSSPATGSSTSTAPSAPIEIAAEASAAPGPNGAPINMPIEVRQVMSGPPPEFL